MGDKLQRLLSLVIPAFAVAPIMLLIIGATEAQAFSTSQIQTKLPEGVSSAYSWDKSCRDYLYANRNDNSQTLRFRINNGASYKEQTWLSGRSHPNVSSPVYVDWGTRKVDLQINSTTFICATLVNRDKWPSLNYNVANVPHARNLYNETERWVKQNDANDRRPNKIGSLNMWPARVDKRTRVDSISVVGGGGTVSGGVGSQIKVNRSDWSRYWFADPVDVTYTHNTDFVSEQTITIRMKYRFITGYHARSGYSRVETCNSVSDRSVAVADRGLNSLGYNECYQFTTDLRVKVRPRVIYNYELTPLVSADSNLVSPGQDIGFSYSVDKTGSNSMSTSLSVRQFIIPPGGSFNQNAGQRDNVNESACNPGYGSNVCQTTVGSRSGYIFNQSTTQITNMPTSATSVNTSNFEAGTLVCHILTVSPPTHNSSPFNRWSAPKCVRIGKNPTAQIRGGDAWSGGSFSSGSLICPASTASGFTGLNSVANGITYGSWGEYGLFSTGSISAFGSGAKAGSRYSTFANTNPARLGYWQGSSPTGRCMTDFSSMFGQGTNNPAGNINLNAANINGLINASTMNRDVVIFANSPIQAGKRIVIKTSANQRIVIRGQQLAYAPGPYTTLRDIPQVVIIGGGDVVIDSDVTRIDAWIQAKGTLYTCDTPGDAQGRLTINQCNKQLTFNGPVTANKISLRRTAGAEQGRLGEPAEIFNLRPDVFLSAYSNGAASSAFETVYQAELPPRY